MATEAAIATNSEVDTSVCAIRFSDNICHEIISQKKWMACGPDTVLGLRTYLCLQHKAADTLGLSMLGLYIHHATVPHRWDLYSCCAISTQVLIGGKP